MIRQSVSAILVLVVGMLGSVQPVSGSVVPDRSITQQVAQAAPDVSAHAVTLVDEATGQVLYARAASARVAPASTTKLMVALLVAETGRYFDQVTIERADLVGGSSMGLASGVEMSVRALLDGLLIVSGNDAAYALARHFGSSLPGPGSPVSRFVAQMNTRARELGLAETAFRNPAGLDAEGHYSTAADLAVLARFALRQPVVAQVVAMPSVTGRMGTKTYTLRNTNLLVGDLPGALGVKTGTTEAAGECLIALVERDGHRLLSVVLGSEERYADTKNLIEWGFAQHQWVRPPPEVAVRLTPRGHSASFVAAPPVAVPAARIHDLTYQLRSVTPGALTGAIVDIRLGEQSLASRELVIYPLGQTRRPLPGW